MDNNAGHSADAYLAELGQRISRYRLNRNVTQVDLAREAGVSTSTLQRIEQGEPTTTLNLVRILQALGLLANLDALVPEPAVSPLQQLRTRRKERRRASRADSSGPQEPWSWGDDE